MSGRHTRRRLALITAATVIAMPLGVAMAGSAHADTLGGLGGLLGGGTSSLPVVGSALGNSGLPVVGDLLGGVTGGTSAADPTAALSSVTSAADAATAGTPAAGVLQSVTGLAGGGNSAKAIKSAATPDAVSGLLGGSTSGLPVVGGLVGSDSGLPVVGNLGGVLSTVTGLTDTLGLGDLVGGLLGTVTGLVGGITGGLLGGGIDSGEPSNGGHGHSHGNGGDSFEESALPHTGANSDATALMLCAGLAMAGTGVTLVSRRRRAALSV